MLGICVRYLSDRDISEEIMITGFTKVFRNIDQFKNQGDIGAWIRKIMINECLMHLRSDRSMHLLPLSDITEAENCSFMHHEFDKSQLLALVSELPSGYRTVFNMYAIDGFSHKEISEELNISVSTSKTQLRKARQWLQKKIEAIEPSIIKGYKNENYR
jgi:RNA polymerase sigma-70 factor (ECF subfamily)